MRDGRPTSQPEEQLTLAAEVGDEQLEEGIDDESLRSAIAMPAQFVDEEGKLPVEVTIGAPGPHLPLETSQAARLTS